jgi:hypothetical protein
MVWAECWIRVKAFSRAPGSRQRDNVEAIWYSDVRSLPCRMLRPVLLQVRRVLRLWMACSSRRLQADGSPLPR